MWGGVAAVIALALVSGCGGDNSGSKLENANSDAVLSSAQVTSIENALNTGDREAIEEVMAPQARAALGARASTLLPAGSRADIEGSELVVDGDTATIPVTVAGGAAAGRWVLHFVRVESEWRIYGTSKA